MREIEFDISKLSELPSVAEKLVSFSNGQKIFLFIGPMGAGKTTFIKEMCKALGSNDSFSSPTYSIVNEYESPAGKIFHFDLYRIRMIEEMYDLGFEEYLSSGAYCLIEWPEIALDIIGNQFIEVKIIPTGEYRKIIAKTHP